MPLPQPYAFTACLKKNAQVKFSSAQIELLRGSKQSSAAIKSCRLSKAFVDSAFEVQNCDILRGSSYYTTIIVV